MIQHILGSPLYIGEVSYRGEMFPGRHQPIVERELWDHVQILRTSRQLKKPPARPQDDLLLGLLYDDIGRRMRIDSGSHKGIDYRHYRSNPNHRATKTGVPSVRAEGSGIEDLVLAGLCTFLRCRFRLNGAVHSLWLRNRETDSLIDNGLRPLVDWSLATVAVCGSLTKP